MGRHLLEKPYPKFTHNKRAQDILSHALLHLIHLVYNSPAGFFLNPEESVCSLRKALTRLIFSLDSGLSK